MTRTILAAATMLTALALPAHAQRLDTRVLNVWSRDGNTTCNLNASRYVRIDQGKGEATGEFLPIEPRPRFAATLYMDFGATRGASVTGIIFMPTRGLDRPPVRSAKLLIDGVDSGVELSLLGNMDHSERGYVTVPEADRAETARRILAAREFEFVVDEGGPKPRSWHYRFDALRIRDVAEILSIIRYTCTGARAD